MPRSPSQRLLEKLERDSEMASPCKKRSPTAGKVEVVWESERRLHLPSLERETNNERGPGLLRPRIQNIYLSRDARLSNIHDERSNVSGDINESPKSPDTHVGAFHIAGISDSRGCDEQISAAGGLSSGNDVEHVPSVTISMSPDMNADLSIPTAFLVPNDTSTISEGEKELVGDLVVDAKRAPWYSSRKSIFVLSVLFTIAIVGAVVAIIVGSREQRPQNQLQLIKSESRDNGAALSDSDSPQAASFRWLKEDPSIDSYTDAILLERYALATLYESTQGHRWKNNANWMSYDESVCNWAMISCNEKNRVEKVMMKDNGLQGKIPGELFHHLSYLYELDMSVNALSGTLGEDLGGSLAWIRLQDNALSGELTSDSFSKLHKLRSLHLYRNSFEGPLPDIWHLEDLQVLRLNENRFNGSLPSGVGELLNLESLWLHNNNLTGLIPSELGKVHRLDYLILRFNDFSGSIPSELGRLTKMGECFT